MINKIKISNTKIKKDHNLSKITSEFPTKQLNDNDIILITPAQIEKVLYKIDYFNKYYSHAITNISKKDDKVYFTILSWQNNPVSKYKYKVIRKTHHLYINLPSSTINYNFIYLTDSFFDYFNLKEIKKILLIPYYVEIFNEKIYIPIIFINDMIIVYNEIYESPRLKKKIPKEKISSYYLLNRKKILDIFNNIIKLNIPHLQKIEIFDNIINKYLNGNMKIINDLFDLISDSGIISPSEIDKILTTFNLKDIIFSSVNFLRYMVCKYKEKNTNDLEIFDNFIEVVEKVIKHKIDLLEKDKELFDAIFDMYIKVNPRHLLKYFYSKWNSSTNF